MEEQRINKNNKSEAEESEESNLIKQIAILENVAKKNMTKEAISRYGNLKIAHPETAIKAIALIAQASQLGQIKKPLDDSEFKGLLLEIQEEKRSFNFKNF